MEKPDFLKGLPEFTLPTAEELEEVLAGQDKREYYPGNEPDVGQDEEGGF